MAYYARPQKRYDQSRENRGFDVKWAELTTGTYPTYQMDEERYGQTMTPNNPDIKNKIWYAVPVYNNKDTVKDVVKMCLSVLENVVVVDDGSTDVEVSSLLSDLNVDVLIHKKNLGKGQAILTASRYIEEHGGHYIVTIDADGQHNPDDIKKFLPVIRKKKDVVVIGSRDFNTDNVPGKSRFGRKFANFWLRLEAGVYVDDCQSGFRAYPVRYLNQTSFRGKHYDFEVEALTKAAWAGLELTTVPIDVYYPKQEDRVSHFRGLVDNLRISHMHATLLGRRLLPFGHKRLVPPDKSDYKRLLLHPKKFLTMLLKEHASPGELAMSAAVGIFFAILPLLFVHTIVILYFCVRFHLNKVLAVNVQHICMPPFVPALCIELGFYLKHGYWLTEASTEIIFQQFSDRLMEWLLGSLIIAPVGAALAGAIVFFLANRLTKQV